MAHQLDHSSPARTPVCDLVGCREAAEMARDDFCGSSTGLDSAAPCGRCLFPKLRQYATAWHRRAGAAGGRRNRPVLLRPGSRQSERARIAGSAPIAEGHRSRRRPGRGGLRRGCCTGSSHVLNTRLSPFRPPPAPRSVVMCGPIRAVSLHVGPASPQRGDLRADPGHRSPTAATAYESAAVRARRATGFEPAHTWRPAGVPERDSRKLDHRSPEEVLAGVRWWPSRKARKAAPGRRTGTTRLRLPTA
jgi:hypothetical protein